MVKNLQKSIAGLKLLLWLKCRASSVMILRFSSYGTSSGTLASSSAAPIPKEEDDLYQRLLPYAPSTVSMTPIINQWVRERKTAEYTVLKKAIKQLRAYRRFKHALQIYEWMDNSKHLHIPPGDVAVRLDLISKAHGLEAEEYFATIPDNLRSSYVYGALLNCYADAKSLIKAEGTMQKMRDMGDANLLTYNVMMNLYTKMGYLEKLHSLVQEMEDKGIVGNVISYTIKAVIWAGPGPSLNGPNGPGLGSNGPCGWNRPIVGLSPYGPGLNGSGLNGPKCSGLSFF